MVPGVLAETVETGDKNRHDFHCMQMSLVMKMQFIFGDYWNDGPCSIAPVGAVKRNLRSRTEGTVFDACYFPYFVL